MRTLKELQLGGDYECIDDSCQPDSPSTNQLTGPIPPELGNLSDLEVLGLDANRLTGPDTAGVGQPLPTWKLWVLAPTG